MSGLSDKNIRHVAKLAQLTLTDPEIAKFQKQLGKVVEYIGRLNEVNTAGVAPTSQTTGLENIFREDKVNSLEYLKVQNDYFEVDQIINKNG